MKKTLLICLSLIMLALVGCKKSTNTWGKLVETGKVIAVGDTLQLTFEHNGNTCPQWSSEDPFVASVDGGGVVTGMHVGKTTVSVNDLKCTIEVIDEYVDEFDEPRMDWDVSNSDISVYENDMRGIVCMTTTENDTVTRWDITYHNDTTWNEDSTQFSITSVPDTTVVVEYVYIKHATYDYSIGVEEVMIDNVSYDYSYSKDKKTGEYSTYLVQYACKISDAYADEIYEILNNRFYTTDDPDVYYYKLSNNKLCKVYVGNNKAGDTFVTYVPER